MALIILSCAWVAGLLIGARLALPVLLLAAAGFPLLLIPLSPARRRPAVLASLAILALVFANIYAYGRLHAVDTDSVQSYNGTTAEFRGTVAADPEFRERSLALRLSSIEINTGSGWQRVNGDALVSLPRSPEYRHGDQLTLRGKLEAPAEPGYRSYLAGQGISTVVYFPRVSSVAAGQAPPPLAWVYGLRNRLAQVIHRVLPEPQASLVEGIVLGKRGMIPATLRDDFSRSGTAHILAISGLHLTIVAGVLVSAGIWVFGRRHYLYVWLALAAVWLYTLLTGMNPPVVRAAIMSSLFLMSELLGRQRSGLTALCFAAAVMAGISPDILGNASFQMSFLSMAGLILFSRPLNEAADKLAGRLTDGNGAWFRAGNLVGGSLSTSLAALLGIWPLIAYYFGIVSLAGPAATLLALPALPGILLTGMVASAAGLVFWPLALAFGWIAWLFASYLIVLVSAAARVPGSFLEVGQVPAAMVWAYYAGLAAVVLIIRQRRWAAGIADRLKPALVSFQRRLKPKWVIPALAVLAALSSAGAASLPDSRLHVYFLDVGEGDAVLIQKGSQQVLIDGGPDPARLARALGSRMPFWDRTIELLALTHPHQDHLGGQIEVVKRFRIGHLLYPDLKYDSAAFAEWLRLTGDLVIPGTAAQAGERIDLGDGAVINVLSPGARHLTGTDSDIDNNGTVLRLSMGDVSFLFTADIMQPAEQKLVAERPGLSSTVLKTGHHGSNTSTSAEFLASVNPGVVVISSGAGNPFGHPHPTVVERLNSRLGAANVYRTDRSGTVEFITDGKGMWVKTER